MRLTPEERHIYDSIIMYHSLKLDVPMSYIKSTIGTESFWDADTHNANDPGGAWGLMQIIMPTAEWMHGGPIVPFQILFDPFFNVMLGTKYLAYLIKRYGEWPRDIASAYNAGHPARLLSEVPDPTHESMEPIYKNQEYVDRWMRWYKMYTALEPS